MCKKLTKLVSESEAMREELSEYRSAFGDIDSTPTPEGKLNRGRSREAEVKVHLKLVEEEATLLSRRIVELEMENRGLRAEMSDLRDKMGRCGGEEEEEEGEKAKHTERKRERVQEEGNGKADMGSAGRIPREGPGGGERTSFDSSEEDKNKRNLLRGPSGASEEDYQALLALRDHSCILTSAIQLLLKPPKNGHCCSPSALTSPPEADQNGKTHKLLLPAPLGDALELLQAMLVTFIGRMETLLIGEDSGKPQDLSRLRGSFSFLSGGGVDQSHECAEDLRTSEVKETEKPARQVASFQRDSVQSCGDPKMRVSLQILWLLHQWFQDKGSKPEEKQVGGYFFKERKRGGDAAISLTKSSVFPSGKRPNRVGAAAAAAGTRRRTSGGQKRLQRDVQGCRGEEGRKGPPAGCGAAIQREGRPVIRLSGHMSGRRLHRRHQDPPPRI